MSLLLKTVLDYYLTSKIKAKVPKNIEIWSYTSNKIDQNRQSIRYKKLLDDDNIDSLVRLNVIYETDQIPRDWLQSTLISIPNKENANRYEQFRMMSLMSYTLKLKLSRHQRSVFQFHSTTPKMQRP